MLRVKYHEKVDKKHGIKIVKSNGPGYYIEAHFKRNTRTSHQWHSIIDLRFARFKDAEIAMECLKRSGLDSFTKLSKASLDDVLRIATQDLQW